MSNIFSKHHTQISYKLWNTLCLVISYHSVYGLLFVGAVLVIKKTTYALKTPSVVALPFMYGVESCSLYPSSHAESRLHLNQRFLVGIICVSRFLVSAVSLWSKNYFWPGDLDLWPMTLTFELDLDILPLDLHAKIQVNTSVRSAVRARHTDTHTHRQNDDAKTITPVADAGCKKNYGIKMT